MFEAGLKRASSTDVRNSQVQFERRGWRVFVLPDGIDSKRSFFDAVTATLPLDPPLARARDVWEALDDSLWQGLHDLPDDQVAVLWPDAGILAEADPDAYEVVLGIFTALSRGLMDSAYIADGPETTLAVVIGT